MLPDPELSLINLSPDNISNEMINQIGNHYLLLVKQERRSCSKFFYIQYRDESIAERLASYTNENSAHEKWLFLAKCYAELNPSGWAFLQALGSKLPGGVLGKAITDLFAKAFKLEQPIYLLAKAFARITPCPNWHTVKELPTCLDTGFGLSIDISATEQSVSLALHAIISENYISNVDLPLRSKADKHALKVNVKKNYQDYQSMLDAINIPEDLTSGLLNQLGHHKLSSSSSWFPYITNYEVAKKLRDVDAVLSSYKCWIILAEAYRDLDANDRQLKNVITSLFAKVFHEIPYGYNVFSYAGTDAQGRQCTYWAQEPYSPKYLAEVLKGIALKHYDATYRIPDKIPDLVPAPFDI